MLRFFSQLFSKEQGYLEKMDSLKIKIEIQFQKAGISKKTS